MSDDLPGIDPVAVTAWMSDHVDGLVAPLAFSLIAAGGSNLTYRVSDSAGNQWAVRRPPTAHVLASAHDMGREWKIIEGLGRGTGVPVPEAVAFCADTGIIGAPFSIMGFVDGLILRDAASATVLSAADARTATESLVDVQVAFHTLDPESCGLGDLGRPTGYVERQLARWRKQYEAGKVRELPLLEDLHRRMSASVPAEQHPGGLAHGDYRFDNTVLGPDHHIAAVLDWELCTRGDPVADFCWSLMYWADPGDTFFFLSDPPTVGSQFIRRDEYSALYAARSGFDLSDRDWYMAFSYWKQSCIVEGAYARRLAGARTGASSTTDPHTIAERVDTMLVLADESLATLAL